MRRTTFVLPLLAVTAATTLAGCAGGGATSNAGDFEGEEKAVAEAVFDFRDAVARRDNDKVCDSSLSPEYREQIEKLGEQADRGTTCADTVRESFQGVDATDIEIVEDGITITGDKATVKVKTNLPEGQDDAQDTLSLVKDKDWRLARLPGS